MSPDSPPRPCRSPGCPHLTNDPSRYCAAHKRQAQQQQDQQRGTSTERGYDSHWQRIRRMILNAEPLCRTCNAQGLVVAASEVDHIDGNVNNMSTENLQPLCRPCHSRKSVLEQGALGKDRAFRRQNI